MPWNNIYSLLCIIIPLVLSADIWKRPIVNTIICDGDQADLPRGIYGPTQGEYVEGKSLHRDMPIWSAQNFSSAVDLCSATGNLAANIGGVCVEENDKSRSIRFCVALAWTTALFSNELAQFCDENCRCAQDEDAFLRASLLRAKAACAMSAMLSPEECTVDIVRASVDFDEDQNQDLSPGSGDRREGLSVSPSPTPSAKALIGNMRPFRGRPSYVPGRDRCSTRCEDGRCEHRESMRYAYQEGSSSSSRQLCACVVRQYSKSLFVPLGCRDSARLNWNNGRKLKRHGELDRPAFGVDGPLCSCNSSYVSQSCCWATDGIVRNPGDVSLGTLFDDSL